ncbi:glycosyl hydrolase family 61-domain-containing protein [Coniochaeta sp. 2T2.1]|nr:glycosyl hydrolase family 61-domain-containing protein [Coniochaeta sp. 2T2.1]
MLSFTSKTLLAALTGAVTVAAHGHVNDIIVNGVLWQGYNPFVMPYIQNPPNVVGWQTDALDNGFVLPDAFASADMACHRNAKNAGGHAVVAAGDKILLEWDTWPEGHKGPVMDYLANCGSAGCESVDKTTLKFFKIDEVGLIDGSNSPGTWGSDQLIANNNSWLVEIPPTIAPGFYVLRHEMIALHSAFDSNAAQAYPQCFNLEVTGGGSDNPEGVLATELYNAEDPGIHINIYYPPLSTYTIPGPALYSGAVSIAQAKSVATASSSAVTGSVLAAAPTAANPTTAKNDGGAAAPTTAANAVVTDAPSVTAAPVKPTVDCTGPVTRTVTVRAHARDVRKH